MNGALLPFLFPTMDSWLSVLPYCSNRVCKITDALPLWKIAICISFILLSTRATHAQREEIEGGGVNKFFIVYSMLKIMNIWLGEY